MRVCLCTFLIALCWISNGQLRTPFEQGDGNQTGTYEEVIGFYRQLAAQSSFVEIREMGTTDAGLPLQLVILDPRQNFDPERTSDQTVVLINNGIHPGEPDGIEASMLLLRDYVVGERIKEIEDLFVAVIPVYNIGGALNRNTATRANQNGPEAHGFRGNARNFDLNRDFVKTDTKNASSFQEIFHVLDPDVFVDTHVSNGADYQYVITHLATQHNKLGGSLGEYVEDTFTRDLEAKMLDKGSEITPYVNVFGRTPDPDGFTQFLDNPRYSTGYTALFGTVGFMIETHMLKPFDARVKSSYDFLESVLELALRDGMKIKELRSESRNTFKPGIRHSVAWQVDRERARAISFKGYEGTMQKSKVTGLKRLKYDRDKPYSKILPYYNTFVPAREVIVPTAYLVPQGWHGVVDLLRANGCAFTRLEQDSTISVEAYRISDFETVEQPYEGHYLHYNTQTTKSEQSITFRAGDYLFSTDQRSGRFLVEVLEPEATDSYFNWNFFDTILQRKEGFSPYVFEEVAEELLKSNPKLRQELEQMKSADPDFAASAFAQLNFLYERSPNYESAHLSYPVYRLK